MISKNNIVQEYEAGKGYRKLSKEFNIPVSSVQSIIKKWKEQGSVTIKPKTGAPKRINLRTCSKLVRMVKNPRTIRKEMVEENFIHKSQRHQTEVRDFACTRQEGFP